MTNVVPMKDPFSEPEYCLEHVRNAAWSGTLDFDQPHFKERLEERDITMRQVLATLQKGELISGPVKDKYGDWRVKLRRYVAGRKVQIVVAVNVGTCVCVTAI